LQSAAVNDPKIRLHHLSPVPCFESGCKAKCVFGFANEHRTLRESAVRGDVCRSEASEIAAR
jgi:hypothetical protein